MNKEEFIKEMKRRTKSLAVDTILFIETLKPCKGTNVITYQLVKSATSTGANYRAACRARSRKEFFSKMSIVVEELDESMYWLEVIEAVKLSNDTDTLKSLLKESDELIRILSKARSNAA